MTPLAAFAGTSIGLVVLGVVVALFGAGLYTLDRRFDPLRHLKQFRVQRAPGLQFHRITYATIGDTPKYPAAYTNSLSFALNADWVYLRRSRIPFFPRIWRMPRAMVRVCEHPEWNVRIASNPPLGANLGPDFPAAFRAS